MGVVGWGCGPSLSAAQMAERLGLKLSKEEVKQAETDAYIIKRLKEALAVLKFCDSEGPRQDLHVVLGALAPERAALDNCW